MAAANDLAQSAYDAGFRGNDLVTITAIGLAEGGTPQSTLDRRASTGEYSVGPWQINLSAWGSMITEVAARSYSGAAQLAHYIVYQSGQGFEAWSTYSNGDYTAHTAEAQNAVVALGKADAFSGGSAASSGGGSTTNIDFTSGAEAALAGPFAGLFKSIPGLLTSNPLGALGAGVGSISATFRDLFDALTSAKTWWRIGFTVVGFGLISGGIVIYFFAPRSADEARNDVALAAKAGAA